MAKKILEVKNLSKYFISKYGVNKAVDNVSFDLNEGEIIGLVGQSGSGKSTIGNALMRTLTEVNGVMVLDGKVISGKLNKKTRRSYRQKVQMIFQDPHTSLNEKRNVFSAIAEPLKTNKIIQKETKEFLENNKEVRKVFNLSFKTKQLDNELNHLKMKKSLFKKALEDIEINLTNYEGLNFKDFDNELAELIYSFFQPIAEAYRLVFNNLVASNDELYNIYVKASNDVRNKNLPSDEVALVNSTENIARLKKEIKTFNSQIRFVSAVETKNRKSIRNEVKRTKILINGFIKDYKRKIKFHKSVADVQPDNKIYSEEIEKTEIAKGIIKKLVILRNSKPILSTKEMISFIEIIKETDSETIVKKGMVLTSEKKTKMIESNKNKIAEIEKIFANFDLEKAKEELVSVKAKLVKDQALFDEELVKFKKQWDSEFETKKNILIEIGKETNEAYLEGTFKDVTSHFNTLVDKFIESWKAKSNGNKKDKVKFKNAKKLIKEERTKLNDFVSEEKLLIKKVEKSKVFLGMKRPSQTLYRDTKKILLNRRVFKSLSDVGLKAEHAYRYPHEFSGGQKQRIVIARALIMNPKVIVADEPIASLDVSIQAQIVNILVRLARRDNISMIFIGHDLSVIEYLADSMLVMHLGRIVEKGATGPIFGNPVHPYTNSLFDAIPKLSTANEPFKSTSLKENYIEGYEQDTPEFKYVEKDHLVLMNDEQASRWVKGYKKENIKSEVNEVSDIIKTQMIRIEQEKDLLQKYETDFTKQSLIPAKKQVKDKLLKIQKEEKLKHSFSKKTKK